VIVVLKVLVGLAETLVLIEVPEVLEGYQEDLEKFEGSCDTLEGVEAQKVLIGPLEPPEGNEVRNVRADLWEALEGLGVP
jgi:hypothetical protein